MIRANTEAEISSLECKIEQKHKEMLRIADLITKLADQHAKLSEDVGDIIIKISELRDQLEDEND